MTTLCARLSYFLMLSIALLSTGFLGLGVHAFASARISCLIYLGAFGVVLVTIPLYFVRRGLLANLAKITRRSSATWQVQGRPQVVPMRSDRRRPLVQGREWVAVVLERRTKQLAGASVVGLAAIASETLRG
jgi:hypothetical protein